MRKFVLPAVAVLSLLTGAGVTAAAESNMQARTALNYLVKAQQEIVTASPDKAGHTKRAAEYVMSAIHEVSSWEREK